MKINLVQFILSSESILAVRFLRNIGYLVEREVLSTFWCEFPSKRGFEKSKNTEVFLNLHFKMAALRCFFPIQNNLVDCILSGQYILANRFLRNSGCLVEHEILSTFGCQFPSKVSFEKSKKTVVCLNLTFKMAALRCFFGMKINLVQCILCGQSILAVRFLRNSGYLVEREVLSTFVCQFLSKKSFEKSKNTEVYLNLTLKWRR